MAETENPAARSTALDIAELEASVERSRAERERRTRVSGVVYPIGVVLGLLVVWEAATRLFGVPAFLLPAPSAIGASIVANSHQLLSHGWITTLEIVLGFA